MSRRLKTLVSLIVDQTDLGDLPYIALEHLAGGTGSLEPNIELPRHLRAETGVSAVQPGDVLFGKLRPYLAKTLLIREPAYASTELLALRAGPALEARYLAYLIGSRPIIEWATATSDGTKMPRTSWEKIGEFRISNLPTLTEQCAVADYLDAETARIDSLIEKKRRFIELLLLRQARFERSSVTGEDQSDTHSLISTGNQLVPMLPATWHLVRTRFLCSIETGSSDTDESSANGLYPFFVRSQTPQLSDRFIFDTEAVMTAGDGAGVGKVFHHFKGKFDAHQRVYVLHGFRGVEARYFFYFFSSFFALAALDGSAKSTVDSVRRHMITELPIAVPPIGDQRRIIKDLDSSRTRTENLVRRVGEQVELLRERRQSLISAAVTGELEVPGVAA